MDSQENQIIAQYAMLQDKVIEIENEIKTNRAKIDQEINKIEAYNNIFLQDEEDGFSNILQTEKNSESIIRLAPILEPAFVNGFDKFPLPIQLHNNLIQQTNQFEVRFLATQPMKKNISLLDIHTFNDSICIGSDSMLRIYNIKDGSVNFDWDVSVDSFQNNITCISKVHGTNLIVVGFEDGFIRFFDTSSIVISEFPVSSESLSSIFYSSKQILYCFAVNGEISCWRGENNCLQTCVFDGQIKYFEEIKDDTKTDDIYIISEDLNKFRWYIENNELVLIKEKISDKYTKSETQNGQKFMISAEENHINIISHNDYSSSLTLDTPEYNLFDKNKSYFCFSTGARFSIYKVLVKNQQVYIKPQRSSAMPKKSKDIPATKNSEKPAINSESPAINIDNFSIDGYMIGNVNQERIKNQSDDESSTNKS